MNSPIEELGIGLICFPGMETVVQSLSGYIDVVEIEPLTSWFTTSPESDSFCFNPDFARTLTALPQPKIFHGVGFPIGGTILPRKEHFERLNSHIRAIQPVYTSEHLSFHRFCNTEGRIHQAGVLLPPLQNQQGVETATRAINYYKNQTGMPFAFETRINYLQCRQGEMEDGEFIARIAEDSDAYIILDLHNLLTNQLNGRQSVKDLVRQLPVERVIEIHLRSDISSPEMFALTDSIVRDLPCLKCVVFEAQPDTREVFQKYLRNYLIGLKDIWDHRNRNAINGHRYKRIRSEKPVDNHLIPEVWEYALGSIVDSCVEEELPLQQELLRDPGINVFKEQCGSPKPSRLITQ